MHKRQIIGYDQFVSSKKMSYCNEKVGRRVIVTGNLNLGTLLSDVKLKACPVKHHVQDVHSPAKHAKTAGGFTGMDKTV